MSTSASILFKRFSEIKDFIGQARVEMALDRMWSVIVDYTPVEDGDPFSLYDNPFYKKWEDTITALKFRHSEITNRFENNYITDQERTVQMNRLVASLMRERINLIEELRYKVGARAAA